MKFVFNTRCSLLLPIINVCHESGKSCGSVDMLLLLSFLCVFCTFRTEFYIDFDRCLLRTKIAWLSCFTCINLSVHRNSLHCDNILPIQHRQHSTVLQNCEFIIKISIIFHGTDDRWMCFENMPNLSSTTNGMVRNTKHKGIENAWDGIQCLSLECVTKWYFILFHRCDVLSAFILHLPAKYVNKLIILMMMLACTVTMNRIESPVKT